MGKGAGSKAGGGGGGGGQGKSTGGGGRSELEKTRDEVNRAYDEADRLRRARPRSIQKVFGTNGPTPEQKARYDSDVKEWNKQYRKNQKDLKAGIEKSNKLLRESKG